MLFIIYIFEGSYLKDSQLIKEPYLLLMDEANVKAFLTNIGELIDDFIPEYIRA